MAMRGREGAGTHVYCKGVATESEKQKWVLGKIYIIYNSTRKYNGLLSYITPPPLSQRYTDEKPEKAKQFAIKIK